MSSLLRPKLRIAAIDFLNPAPLMWDFEHPPESEALAERYSIHRTTPANCARELADRSADIGLIPAAAYAQIEDLTIIPGCAIASLDRVRSILLVAREGPIARVQTIAADTSSLTSLAYTRILFHRYWNPAAAFVQHPPGLDSMLKSADAALLIGDPALLALEDRQGRLERTGERLIYLDLAHEWRQRTGLPWVSAFWAVRVEALKFSRTSPAKIVADFQRSRDRGLAHIDDLVAEWSPRIAVPRATIRHYLSSNIHYTLDQPCLDGLLAFYRAAAECGILPPVPALRLL